MRPHFLVFQHVDVEHPGIFRDLMRSQGITWDTIRFDLAHPIPKNIGKYSGLISLGGPMDVWEKDRYPWILEEEEFIRKWVLEFKKPFLGICLGHQLLASSLGGKVAKAKTAEVGIHRVDLSEEGRRHGFFRQCPITFECLQWHSSEVTEAPPEALVLAHSEKCEVQSLAVGDHAFSFQFHLEVTQSTVDDWVKIEAYKRDLESALGPQGLELFRKETAGSLNNLNSLAKKVFDNWQKTSRFISA